MTMVELEYVQCDLCGKNLTKFLFAVRSEVCPSEKFNIVKCVNCGLIYVNPRPSRSSILNYYKEEICKPAHTDGDSIRRFKAAFLKLLRDFDIWAVESFGKPPAKILDVGCGDGEYLKKLKNLGFETYGVDINPRAVEVARRKGLNVFLGELHEAKYPDNFFDVIILKDVLEHVHSPTSVLEEAFRILKPGGILKVGGPSFGVEARMSSRFWSLLNVPQHLYFFTPQTLSLLVRKAGFSIERVVHQPSGAALLKSICKMVSIEPSILEKNLYLKYTIQAPFELLSSFLCKTQLGSSAMTIIARKRGKE